MASICCSPKAARARDVEKVRELIVIHMTEAPRYVKRMKGKLRERLILDSEIRKRLRTRSVAPVEDSGDTED
jgi:GntR family transcriptional repressor for pyruvate dehydrogenase complex